MKKPPVKISKKVISFPVIIEQDETGMYVAIVPTLRSCYTQAKTLDILYKRLDEVIGLSLEAEKKLFKKIPEQNTFIGFQNYHYI